ncbi:SAM-dependent methyltransferase [Mycobacterium marseillense]|uniref:S-adenosyl-L-methionine-dependent methyltransferase n=1 Tax=Mycobacterium marseillense TaxID=701042 RepID=A0AAC9YJW3_9MYCO|nr:SAM-dependent methyltransferase [Mycobacterium marseillense]ASW89831.1 SAM-dependent methyltransferase [Mycobacterium marseillense]
MSRCNDDTWNLATSVGATATLVAAARAAASRQIDPIINDPFAAPLVRAAGVELFARLAGGEVEFADIGSGWLPDFFGVRTRFFDRYFLASLSTGIRQAVIVASGLDSRAYRLTWPTGTVVYEVDQPEVIAFKDSTLSALGVKPAVELRTVGADLRYDWPNTLQHKGFDYATPTAWMLEGLMIGYLPGEAQNHMLDRISALSAQGSQMIADHLPAKSRSVGSIITGLADQWRQHGFDIDFNHLTYPHDQNDAEGHLQALGWHTTAYRLTDLLLDAGVPAGSIDAGPNGPGAVHYLTAEK